MSETVRGLRVAADGSTTEVSVAAPPPSGQRRGRQRDQWLPAITLLSRIVPEYVAIRRAATEALAAGNGQLSLWIDTLTAQGGCNLADAATIAAKAGLVEAGMLTQERADAVFAPV